MTNTACASRRLVQAVIQVHSTRTASRHFPCYHPHPKDWVRTVTSSSPRHRNNPPGVTVTFGKDNDGVIAPYIKTSRKKGKSKKATTEPEQSLVNDDYEIGGFVDRSTSKATRSLKPLEAKLETPDEEVVAAGSATQKRKTGKVRSNDNRFGDRQVTGGHKPPFSKITTKQRGITNDTKTRQGSAATRGRSIEDGPRGKIRNVQTSTPVKVNRVDSSFRKIQSENQLVAPRRVKFDVQPKRPSTSGQPLEKKKVEDVSWTTQKNALKEKFKEGWQPRKKLSPDAIEGVRDLHEQDPIKYSTEYLAQQFQMSPEAIRRILKSKWSSKQGADKLQERRERWAKRHDRIWDSQAELGLRPPRTKDKEIEDPDKFEQDLERRRILGEI